MPDHPLKIRDLRRILRAYGVQESVQRGKGSHSMFWLKVEGGTLRFFVPHHGDAVLLVYVRKLRQKFSLTVAEGISDSDFYGH